MEVTVMAMQGFNGSFGPFDKSCYALFVSPYMGRISNPESERAGFQLLLYMPLLLCVMHLLSRSI